MVREARARRRRLRNFVPEHTTTMHIIAYHRITDPEGFQRWTEEPVAGRPPHWRLILSAPTRDGAACLGLWWADSAEALRRFLERALGDVSVVECHEVDEENALGLSGRAGVSIQLLPRH